MSVEIFGGKEELGEVSAYLLDDVSAAGSGEWLNISALRSGTIHVQELVSGDSITVHLSNDPAPALADDGAIDQTINGGSSEQIVNVSHLPANFIKLKKVGANGSATAIFHGLKR